MPMKLHIEGLADTERLGLLLSGLFRPGICFTLHGPLGAGKSALARAMVSAGCDETGDIPSPTFTLVQTYDMSDGTAVWHMDLYRLKDLNEVLALGIEDAFYEAVCLVEWPDRLDGFLPINTVSVEIAFDAASDTARKFIIDGTDALLQQIQKLDTDGFLVAKQQ